MKIELTTVSTKKFLLITLLSIPLILLFSIGLAVSTNIQWITLLIIPLLGLSIYLGQKLSKRTMSIDLSENEYLIIDNQKISCRDITGYFIDETGLTQTALCLRLNSTRTIQITGVSVGEQGKEFQKAKDEIIRALKSRNNQLLQLEYQDVYERQTNILRPFIYIMVGVAIILDLLAIYLLMTEKMNLPWQVFFVNFFLVGLIPYLKKDKITNANTGYTK